VNSWFNHGHIAVPFNATDGHPKEASWRLLKATTGHDADPGGRIPAGGRLPIPNVYVL